MRCETCQSLLVDYRYRELAADAEQDVAKHLGSCSACALAYCRLDADLSGIAAAVDEGPSPSVHAALKKRVAEAFPAPKPSRMARLFQIRIPLYQPLLVAALVAAVWLIVAGAPALDQPGATTAIEEYDAGRVVVVDPRVL